MANPIVEMIRAGKKYLPRRVRAGSLSPGSFVRRITPEVADRVLRERVADALTAASKTKYGEGARGQAQVLELAEDSRGGIAVHGDPIVDEVAKRAYEHWKQRMLGGTKRPYRGYSDEDLGRLLGMSELGLPRKSSWTPKSGIEMDIADEFGVPPYFRREALRELSERIPRRNTVGAVLSERIPDLDPVKYPSRHRLNFHDYKMEEPTEIIKGLLSVDDSRANVSLLESLLGETVGVVHPDIDVPLHSRMVPQKPFKKTPGIKAGRPRRGPAKRRKRGKHSN